MRIAGGIFLTLGIIALLLVRLWIRVDGRIDLFNAEILTVGITMVFCSLFFFLRSRDPNLKSWEEEMEEKNG